MSNNPHDWGLMAVCIVLLGVVIYLSVWRL